jgi:hypothetical protein
MSQAVVDSFESIEVHKYDGEGALGVSFRPRDRAPKVVAERSAIRQLRELVVKSAQFQRLIEVPTFGDVVRDLYESTRFSAANWLEPLNLSFGI